MDAIQRYFTRVREWIYTPTFNNRDEADNDIIHIFSKLKDPKYHGSNVLRFLQKESPLAQRREFVPVGTKHKATPFLKVLSWNMLSQALGESEKILPKGLPSLHWQKRRFRILREVTRHTPDVICLQEVDHFRFLDASLGMNGYIGEFLSTPASECLRVPDNNGPDGVAIFYDASKFDWLHWSSRVLNIWKFKTNEVVLGGVLRARSNNVEVFIAVTHLKANTSAYKQWIRDNEGRDLLQWVEYEACDRPVILCGDFNTEPTETMYQDIMRHSLNLRSAYRVKGFEPGYTSWKHCDGKDVKKTVDYIFHSKALVPVRVMEIPAAEEVGEERFPSDAYPSHHLALIAEFDINMYNTRRMRYEETDF